MKSLLKIIFMIWVASQLVSCSSPEPMVCDTGTGCSFAGGNWETCCSSTQCELRTSGTDFSCAGTDCTSATVQLMSYCSGSAKTSLGTESELFNALVIEKVNNVLLRKSIDEMYNDLGKDVQQGKE